MRAMIIENNGILMLNTALRIMLKPIRMTTAPQKKLLNKKPIFTCPPFYLVIKLCLYNYNRHIYLILTQAAVMSGIIMRVFTEYSVLYHIVFFWNENIITDPVP